LKILVLLFDCICEALSLKKERTAWSNDPLVDQVYLISPFQIFGEEWYF